MDDAGSRLEALRRARVVADPRKFRDYVLVPGYPGGKDRIFIERLGFRPRSIVDAWEHARLYEQQARERIAAGAVHSSRSNPYGELFIIAIVVRGVGIQTAWLLSGDVIRLVTPFSRFSHDASEG